MNPRQHQCRDGHTPIVRELIVLLRLRPYLKKALLISLERADWRGIRTLEQYYTFLDETVHLIPTDRNILPTILEFYWLIDHSPDDILNTDPAFERWMTKFADDWGNFLNTPESAEGLQTFDLDPAYHMEDYAPNPSGWLTYNQFFAREVRPGARPIASPCDDSVIVSPADSVFVGQWPISDRSTITSKGFTYSVIALLDGSPYQDRFRDGIFTHSFLDVNDYHRFHVPAGGTVLELRDIPGRVVLDVIRKPDGTLDAVDGTGYQFTQARGLIVLDTPVGLVAVLPMGMAQVSSVTLTPRVGAVLGKGEEFGYFTFGGSDIVTLYEAGRVELTATVNVHYDQGAAIGRARR
jgi:phosphatidylserine decarboxylase precursor